MRNKEVSNNDNQIDPFEAEMDSWDENREEEEVPVRKKSKKTGRKRKKSSGSSRYSSGRKSGNYGNSGSGIGKGATVAICIVLVIALVLGAVSLVTISGQKKNLESLSAQVNELQTSLDEKQQQIDSMQTKVDGDIQVYLPDTIYVAYGRTLELYNAQVAFAGDLEDYSFNWVCDIGKCLDRKYEVVGQRDDDGAHDLTLTIYNKYMETVFEKTVTLQVVTNWVTQSVKILNIGDSFSDNTPWYQEVTTLSEDQITFVGTRGEGNAMHEGRSGFTICDYLTETDYPYGDEGVQPFYNPAKDTFDYEYYLDNTGLDPDVIQIFLGKNGMSLDPEPGIEWLQQMVDDIRSVDPDIPIYIVQTTYMGDQNGLGNETDNKGASALNGWFKKQEDQKVFLWTKALGDAFSDQYNVCLVPVALTFDAAYNYATEEVQVNARNARTEIVESEALHPSDEGYLQIADELFDTYCGTLNNMLP